MVSLDSNQAIVLTYYEKYLGTCKKRAYFWIRPFCDKKYLSLKSNQYNGRMINDNGKKGNPIFIRFFVYEKYQTIRKQFMELIMMPHLYQFRLNHQ